MPLAPDPFAATDPDIAPNLRTVRDCEELPSIDFVVLTRGDRPEMLDRALRSGRAQQSVHIRPLVVWNGSAASCDEVPSLELPTNQGVTAGRNQGAAVGEAPIILFLDDDAEILGEDVGTRLVSAFERRPELGAVAMRIRDQYGQTSARHVPRFGGWSAARSGDVTAFLGGAVAFRRAAFEAADGYGDELFYSMEETDLGWRLLDKGWAIEYDADLCVSHPKVDPRRHPSGQRMTARNRIWIARRNLPLPLMIVYPSAWLLVGLARAIRSASGMRAVFTGMLEGIRSTPFERSPISWRTVWHLTRLGRPPVL